MLEILSFSFNRSCARQVDMPNTAVYTGRPDNHSCARQVGCAIAAILDG